MKKDWTHPTRTKPRTILEDMKAVISFPVLTKRARRQAKKLFPKTIQVPRGYSLLYKMQSNNESPRQMPAYMVRQWEVIEVTAQKLYKKGYRRLSSLQRTKVFETINEHRAEHKPKLVN